MSKDFYDTLQRRYQANGILELVLAEDIPRHNVEEIINALAKISAFFGVKIVVEDGGDGNPNAIPLSSLAKGHRNSSPGARP